LQGRIAGDAETVVTLLSEVGDARATTTLAAELERGRVPMPIVLKALGATGDPAALVPVLGTLSSKDAAIRVAAMEALRPLLGRDARAGDVLIEHLSDDELEVRVLAAEYLGILRVAAAGPKLASLAGVGNPTRLRHAAIDALGEIGRPEGTRALLAVLREGPAELHASAATALTYIADRAAIAPLVTQAMLDRSPTRHEVIRALGGTLRGQPEGNARKLLRQLALDGNIKVSLSAIGGLAAANHPDDTSFLRTMVEQASTDRRRAAAWALGEMHDAGSVGVLSRAMSNKDDRLVGDAAWALGEIFGREPHTAGLTTVVQRWLHVTKHGGWAGAINSMAALSRSLWALPRPTRNQLLAAPNRAALFSLAFHKSRLVRINFAQALGSLSGDEEAAKVLAKLLRDDSSPHVRIAAARALGRARMGKQALITTADSDPDPNVRAAAKAAQPGLAGPGPRNEWRFFYVVDPNADDAPVRQERYFVHTSDGVVWASYTDARGALATEHAPAGEATVWAASREGEY
ncbi:MAG: HEAT repeat domain-containing protein, partial [Kofleriaceae bacterium]